MNMKLSVCPQAFYHVDPREALEMISGLGIEAIELPLHKGNPWFDPDDLVRKST